MGLPWCLRLVCRCSAPTLTVPHQCCKIHPSSPSLIHSGIQKPQPQTSDSHTNGPHCPRRDHTHMRLTQRPCHCILQSTCCNTSAPPGHPTMGQTNTARIEEAACYHSSTYANRTTFYTAPNALSQQRPNPRLTSKGGNSESERLPVTTKGTINQE